LNIVTGILRVKIFSVLLGVTGLGITSQLTNFQNFLLFVVPIGIPLGLTRYISENDENEKELNNVIFLNSLRVILISSLLFTAIISLFSVSISFLIFDDAKYYLLIIIVALSIPFATYTSFLDAYLRGLKDITLLVKILVSGTVFSFIITVILVFLFKLEGVVIGLLTGNIFTLIIYFYAMKRKSMIPKLNIFTKFNKKIIRNIIKIGLASLIVGAINQLVLLIIRTVTISNLGIYGNGIYQSVLGISLNYFGFIYITINIYSFPKISSLKTEAEVIDEINVNFRYIFFLMIPLVALVFIFRELVIALLFTRDFASSEPLYKYQFLGDLFKAFSWVIGLWLIPKLKLFLWVTLDLILNFNFLVVYIFLLNFYSKGLESLAIAYLFSYVVHFALNLITARKKLNFSFRSKNLRDAVTGVILLLVLIGVSEYNIVAGYVSIFPVLFFWFLFVLKKSEWSFIKNNFNKYITNRFFA